MRSWQALSVAGLAALVLASCAPPAGEPETQAAGPAPQFDLATARVVDLTHPFDEHTIYWPTSPSAFELEQLAHGHTAGGYFYAANRISTPEHGGTHLDAPLHFSEHGWSTAQVPLDRLIGAAVVIDVGEQAEADPDYRLTLADVQAWEQRHGAVPRGAIVLLRTGWSKRWPDRAAYLGGATASDLHFPSYGEEAVEHLIAERQVAILGVDTASIDAGSSQDFAVHRMAAATNVPGLENLTNLDQLPPTGSWIIALPMKIAGGSGGPLRAVALVAGGSGPGAAPGTR